MEIYVQVTNDVEDVEGLQNDNFPIPGELHDVNRREAGGRNRKTKLKQKLRR